MLLVTLVLAVGDTRGGSDQLFLFHFASCAFLEDCGFNRGVGLDEGRLVNGFLQAVYYLDGHVLHCASGLILGVSIYSVHKLQHWLTDLLHKFFSQQLKT